MSSLIWEKSNSQIKDLIFGKIPFLLIPHVISEPICVSLCDEIFSNYKATDDSGPVTKIGTSLSSYIYEKSKYFSNSKKSNIIIQNIFSNSISPLNVMHKTISEFFQKQVFTATEDVMSYSECVIRIHKDGDSVHLHRDNCNFEMPDYSVSKYKNQLSAILYLQSPHLGGELTIYDKQWSRYDERMRQPDFGYSSDLINDVPHTTISPLAGNLILFNPNFYHRIECVHGIKPRVSVGFFFAESFDGNLYCWT